MKKLLIIFVIFSITITVKADFVTDMNSCTKDKCGNDAKCVSVSESTAVCYNDCQYKLEQDRDQCVTGCYKDMNSQVTWQNDFFACIRTVQANIINFSLLIIFGFYLMI